jgi:hypothetical protein
VNRKNEESKKLKEELHQKFMKKKEEKQREGEADSKKLE